MPEQITKLKVFVASPGDVRKERELLDGVIDELNRGIAAEKGLVLELVRWETHAWPDIGEDAQDVINRQIAPGDVFVGIMWNRFGTPTRRAESGTKEEFDRAYTYWKKYGRPRIMFYFSRVPFSPSSEDELEQKRKVLAFKKELGDKGALYWEYDGADEFERVVRGHLTQVIRQWEPESGVPKQVSKESAVLLAEYHAALIRKFEVLDLRQITWLGDLRLPLDSIYVRLQATGQLPPGDIPFDVETLKARGILSTAEATIRGETSQPASEQHPLPKPPPPPVPVEVALQHSRHLVALGEPGSGKTTLLHYLALQFARQQARSNLGLETERLPIYLRLGDYAEALKSDPALSLPRFVVQTLAAAATSLPAQVVEEELREGRCVLLLDALDEVSSDLRRKVAEQIDDFFNSSDYSRNRVVATSRIAGYQPVRLQARSAETYTLRPFRRAEVETFARKWFQAVAEAQSLPDPDGEAERQTAAFLEQAQRPDVSRLLNTPLLLHLAVAVFTDRGTLPESRARLYSEYLDPVLSKRAKARTKVSPPCSSTQMRRTLAKIAWHIHTQGRPVEEQLLEIIEDTVREADPDAVFDYMHQQLGLLADFGERRYDFTHLTFREYFLAHYLYDCWRKDPEATWQLLRPIRNRPEMREPILLLAGLLGEDVDRATSLIHHLGRATPPPHNFPVRVFPKAGWLGRPVLRWFPDWQWAERLEGYLRRDLLLAAYCLNEAGSSGVDEKVSRRLVEELIDLWHANPFDRQRSEILSVMKAMKDNANRQRIASTLVQDLSDRNHQVRWAAAYALGELGEATPSVIDALIQALSNKQTKICMRRWGIKPLCVYLPFREDVGDWIRQNAVHSLGKLGNADPKVIAAIARTMKEDSRRSVSEAAAASLARLSAGNPGAIKVLMEVLRSEPPSEVTPQDVEPHLTRSDLRWYHRRFPPELNIPPAAAVASELNWRAHRAYQEAREIAAYGLSQLDHAGQEVIDVLIEALGDEDSFVRRSAAVGLAQLNHVDVRVIKALASGIEGLIGNAASRSLVQLAQTNPQAMAALVDAANDSSSKRSAIFYAIKQSEHASPETIAILVDALSRPFDGHQDEAAKALGQLGQATPEVIGALVRALYTDYDPGGFIRQAAIVSLGQIGYASDEVIDALIHLMDVGSSDAVHSLGQLGAPTEKVITALKKALTHRLQGVRNVAAINLVQLGCATPETISILIETLKGDSEIRWKFKVWAAHSLGLLAEKAPPEILKAMAYTLKQRDNHYEVFQPVADSLAQLGRFHRNSVIKILLEILANPRLDKPSRSGLGRTIHNYAYDALWAVVEDSSIEH